MTMSSKSYAAFLFDMDGTLISSTAVTERIYTKWAIANGVDVGPLIEMMHGVRTVDVIRKLGRADLDPVHEAEIIGKAEREELDGVLAIPGARDFLAALPPDRWALVTSADRELMLIRMKAAGIPLPAVIVTAEDVTEGKPDPQGYALAARRLGVDPSECLVFEDAPAGILAGERAGADVAVVTFTGTAPEGRDKGRDHPRIHDYLGLSAGPAESGRLALVFPVAAE